MPRSKLMVLDLFCGAGGFSHGFQRAGSKIKYGIDSNKHVQETFEKNHPDAEFILSDITELDPKDFSDVDIVIGSPPCPEFSRAKANPDSFVFYGSKTACYKMVGNAVPPLMSYHLAIAIRRSIHDEN